MNGMNYDEMEPITVYKNIYDENGRFVKYDIRGKGEARRYRGTWATNLSSGRDPILHNYCERLYKNGKSVGWVVKPEVLAAISKIQNTPKSSLEQDFKSDDIPNNSKVVERQVIQMTDINTGKTESWTPKDSTVDKIFRDLNITREEILTASRLASTVNPLVALQEKHKALKKELLELAAEKDRIEQRMLDLTDELATVKKEATTFFE